MAPLASVADLQTLLQRTFSTAESNAAALELDLASGAIREYTGQTISLVTNDVAKLQGTWARELSLPQRPVVSVSSIKINGGTVAAGTWILAEHKLYRGNLPIFNGPDDWGGDLYLSSWLGPMATVEVTYTHGFTVVPDAIRGICLARAVRRFGNPEGDESEQIGNYSHSHGASGQGFTDEERGILDHWEGLALV